MVFTGFLIVLSAFVVSCSHLEKQKVSNKSFVSGPLPINVSVKDVEEDLSRRISIQTSDDIKDKITITAILQTAPLIEAQELSVLKSGEQSRDEAQKNLKSAIKELVTSKTCFLVEIQVYSNVSRSSFDHWSGRAVQSGETFDLTFKALRKLASYDPQNSFKGMPEGLESQSNYSIACTKEALNLKEAIRLQVSPNWDPQKPWYEMAWN